jgi:hypothetical protein
MTEHTDLPDELTPDEARIRNLSTARLDGSTRWHDLTRTHGTCTFDRLPRFGRKPTT